MERFKISIFENEHKQIFPAFETLSIENSNSIVEKLSSLYHLNISDFKEVQETGQYIANIDATSKRFSPLVLYSSSQLPDKVFIIWSAEYQIDIFHFQDFCDCFEYIWYPSADDILITSESFDKLFLIRHDGVIYQISIP